MDHTQEILDYIKSFIKDNAYPPTSRQIADALNLDHNNVVDPVIKQLEKDGKIKSLDNLSSIKIIDTN